MKTYWDQRKPANHTVADMRLPARENGREGVSVFFGFRCLDLVPNSRPELHSPLKSQRFFLITSCHKWESPPPPVLLFVAH